MLSQVDVKMPNNPDFSVLVVSLNGTQVKDQGDSFTCVENAKQVTCHKREIFPSRSWDHDYYVCETTD